MHKSGILGGITVAGVLLFAPALSAETLADGTYKTITDGSEGASTCTLVIRSLDIEHKYGDATFELESTGDGACNWSAVGVSKNYVITSGVVTNGGASALMKLAFPFGPAGKRIELATLDTDGSLRNKELFAKQ